MLHNDLQKLNKYPFHMPGHKRNSSFEILGSEIDITEIKDFDNLHCPVSSIYEIEKQLSKIYKSKKSFMLINGSTVGILAAILAVTNKNDTVIIARNCHQSVYNACLLNELNVIYIEPEYDSQNGFYKKINQKVINEAIKNHSNAKAVIITSPTYEGYVSSNLHSPVPLIIDAAHGAHFGFHGFPDYPSADIVISSLHKTLPALTQTAVANVYNKSYIAGVKKYLDILQTSSPSYVLMNSVSKCIEIINKKSSLFYDLKNNLNEFYKINLKNLKLIKSDDISKIIVSTASAEISGKKLAEILRDDYNIECELESINYIILMSSIADNKNAFKKLAQALTEIDKGLNKCNEKKIKQLHIPQKAFNQYEIKSTLKMPLKQACGLVCAENVLAYPPDIPIICKGEIISNEFIEYIAYCLENKINIISDSNLLPDYILTKDD